MPSVTLVHSPLVGPSSWAGVATELLRRGIDVCVPDLREAAQHEGSVEAVVRSAARQASRADDHVLVGHSGSGLLLPSIADAIGDGVLGFVFVDAHIPPEHGRIPRGNDEFVRFLDALVDDGRLPPWSEWWGTEGMKRMVPDGAVRAALVADMPRLPRSYLDAQFDVPAGWSDAPCGYIRLSELYEPSAADAERRGWPVARFSEGHLHAAVRPAEVASAIVNMLGGLALA